MDVNLAGYTVMQCMVDMAFHLNLARPAEAVRGQRWASVTIEGPFELRRDGATWQLDAEARREELGPALGLAFRQVTAATISDEGTLEMEFGDGVSLRAPCLAMYEAWNVFEGDGSSRCRGARSRNFQRHGHRLISSEREMRRAYATTRCWRCHWGGSGAGQRGN